jgi:hypothetical protein
MFHYNNVAAAYHLFVCVVSRAGGQVDLMISDMLAKHLGAVKVF